MTLTAPSQPIADMAARTGTDPTRLANANINPKTGLATDYLNHFNEAIMLLDLIPTMPECIADLLAWQPLSYRDHFATSHFKDRDLAVAAYESADPQARSALEDVVVTMNVILTAACNALQADPASAGELATQAVLWLKPLVARAGAIINGQFVFRTCDTATEAPQIAVDRLFGG